MLGLLPSVNVLLNTSCLKDVTTDLTLKSYKNSSIWDAEFCQKYRKLKNWRICPNSGWMKAESNAWRSWNYVTFFSILFFQFFYLNYFLFICIYLYLFIYFCFDSIFAGALFGIVYLKPEYLNRAIACTNPFSAKID